MCVGIVGRRVFIPFSPPPPTRDHGATNPISPDYSPGACMQVCNETMEDCTLQNYTRGDCAVPGGLLYTE